MSHEPLITEELIARRPPEAQAIIRWLLAKIAELEARLNKTPRNSSLPPSTEHPHAKPPRDKMKSKKKRGGQTGHPKHERPLIPTEECSKVVALYPDACRRCGGELDGDDPEPLRHQIFLNMPCCQSLTVKMQNQVAAALEHPYEEAKQALADEQQLSICVLGSAPKTARESLLRDQSRARGGRRDSRS